MNEEEKQQWLDNMRAEAAEIRKRQDELIAEVRESFRVDRWRSLQLACSLYSADASEWNNPELLAERVWTLAAYLLPLIRGES